MFSPTFSGCVFGADLEGLVQNLVAWTAVCVRVSGLLLWPLVGIMDML